MNFTWFFGTWTKLSSSFSWIFIVKNWTMNWTNGPFLGANELENWTKFIWKRTFTALILLKSHGLLNLNKLHYSTPEDGWQPWDDQGRLQRPGRLGRGLQRVHPHQEVLGVVPPGAVVTGYSLERLQWHTIMMVMRSVYCQQWHNITKWFWVAIEEYT